MLYFNRYTMAGAWKGMKSTLCTLAILLVIHGCAVQAQAPAYLSVDRFRDCLDEITVGTYSSLCMPTSKRAQCPQSSHDTLTQVFTGGYCPGGCSDIGCQNDGTCTEDGTCMCSQSFTGSYCETEPAPAPPPRQEGGENGWSSNPLLRGLPRGSGNQDNEGSDPRLRGAQLRGGSSDGGSDARLRGAERRGGSNDRDQCMQDCGCTWDEYGSILTQDCSDLSWISGMVPAPPPSPPPRQEGGENGWSNNPLLRGLPTRGAGNQDNEEPAPAPPPQQEGGENGWSSNPLLRGLPRGSGNQDNEDAQVGGANGWPGNPNARGLPMRPQPNENTYALDLVFVLDSSSSIQDINSWNIILYFVSGIIDKLPFGQHNVRVGLVTYAETANHHFFLKSYDSKQSLVNKIMDTPFTGGRSNTAQGLQVAYNTQFTASNGDRSEVDNVVILISGGESSINPQYTIPIAQALQTGGANIIAIGINVDADDLKAISSQPREEYRNWWRLRNYSVLGSITQTIVTVIYPDYVPTDPAPTQATTTVYPVFPDVQPRCPPAMGMGMCVEMCSSDSDCTSQQLCCSNGCGHVCMIPTQVERGERGEEEREQTGGTGGSGNELDNGRDHDSEEICPQDCGCTWADDGSILTEDCSDLSWIGDQTDNQDKMDTAMMGPWVAILCELGRLEMECPVGYRIRLDSAIWGRMPNEDVCNDGKVIYDNTCSDPTAIDKLKTRCNDMEKCEFIIHGDVFGNPCEGYRHYLNVTFTCHLPYFTKVACEGDYLSMRCEEGQELSVISATYGRTQGGDGMCPQDGLNNEACADPDSLKSLSALSDGRPWTYVEVMEGIFNDPCPNTAKYLNVTYTCAECTNGWGNDADCDNWAYKGDCETNRDWMHGHCRKSCSHCDTFDECVNSYIVGSNLYSDCDMRAVIGECHSNMDWMIDNCPKSCDLCNLWASKGECTLNAAFMNTYCARSCNTCKMSLQYDLPSVETTTWRPQTTPDAFEVDPTVGVATVTACYGTDAYLACPAGFFIRVFDGFFGRRDGSNDVCKPDWDDDWDNRFTVCESDSSQPFITAVDQCNGRSDCYLWAGKDTFDDECPDQESSRYYLEIDYMCESCQNKHEEDCDCKYWAANNDQCSKNRYWMNNNCFKQCSGCEKTDAYDNISEDSFCDYWATRGSCQTDSIWMTENCAKSCRVAENETPIEECDTIV